MVTFAEPGEIGSEGVGVGVGVLLPPPHPTSPIARTQEAIVDKILIIFGDSIIAREEMPPSIGRIAALLMIPEWFIRLPMVQGQK